jgi:hypothetical protein
MKDLIHRVLHGYRPLYQRGLLLDGQYRSSDISFRNECSDSETAAGTNLNRPRRRVLIAALVAAAAGLMARFDVAIAEPTTRMPMPKPAPHEPSQDFDFFFGRWKVHNRRLKERLAGSAEWEEFDALQECRPILGGMGNQDEFVTDAFGDTHFIGMTVRLFDPKTRAWSIYWIDNRRVVLEPPVTGRFEHGVGTFYGRDEFKGTPILMRFIWTADPEHPRWEQAFSTDDGHSWEVNWVMTMERLT